MSKEGQEPEPIPRGKRNFDFIPFYTQPGEGNGQHEMSEHRMAVASVNFELPNGIVVKKTINYIEVGNGAANSTQQQRFVS